VSDSPEVFGNLADVETRKVRWLWQPYIPYGLLTVLEGDPNVGKSYLAMHVATAVTTGGELPSSPPGHPGRVLYLSTEDDADFTIRPRFETMGGDVNKLRFLVPKHFPFDEEGLHLLRRELDARPAKLLVVDTLFSFIPTTADTNKPNDVRAILSGVSQLASDFEMAVLLIRHWTKGDRGKAIYRGSGSIDIIGLARSAIAVAPYPDDPDLRVMVHVKHNLSAAGPSRLFELAKKGRAAMPVLSWGSEVAITADELQGSATGDPKTLDAAVTLIREQIEGGEFRAKVIKEIAARQGISDRTVDRAKKLLGVKADKAATGWHWSLPTTRTPK
jgi:AAA domain